jgi:hypothetical protein
MMREQFSFDFEKTPVEPPVEVEQESGPELHERDECQNCGNIIESDSPGCVACARNEKKIAYQKQHQQKPKQQKKNLRKR